MKADPFSRLVRNTLDTVLKLCETAGWINLNKGPKCQKKGFRITRQSCVTVTKGSHLVPFCSIIIRICTLSVLQQYNLGNVHVWNKVSGTLFYSGRVHTLVTNDAGCVKSWSLNPYPSRFDSIRRQKLPGDKWWWQYKGWKREKKNPVLYRRYLEKSLWMRAASVVCVTVLYEWYYTHWCLPDSLSCVCFITASLRWYQKSLKLSGHPYFRFLWMLKLVFLVALVRRWLA